MDKTPNRANTTDSSSSSSSTPSPGETKEAQVTRPTGQGAVRPVTGGVPKKRKEFSDHSPEAILKEAEKRYAKTMEDKAKAGEAMSAEEAVQVQYDRMVAAGMAQQTLSVTTDPSEADDQEDEESSSSRSSGQQRGRGLPPHAHTHSLEHAHNTVQHDTVCSCGWAHDVIVLSLYVCS